jgi:hypothetical protein
MHRPAFLTIAFTVVLACSSGPAADDEAGTTTSPSTTGTTDDNTSDESTSTTSDDDDPTFSTSSSSSSENDESPFVGSADDGPWFTDCDSFAQDCPEGEKCVPYATSGNSWDALKCVPIMGDQAPGEPCMYDGPFESTDDCDGTSWCLDSRGEGVGVCHAFCSGTPDTPECPPMSQCSISGAGVVNICLPSCDPIIQDCPEGAACFWSNIDFTCIVTTQDIPLGDPCGFVNDCAEGNMCTTADVLPACIAAACCANFCDLGLGDMQCAVTPGTVCVPFFEQGMAPPWYEHVGLCVLPP